jgi:nucleotide-binding universal stress UspA family protein
MPLRLLGAPGASRLLADASLVLQQMVAILPETVLVEDVVAATRGAGLLVIGLSERYREEGLGAVRSEIARRAEAPVLFVRRGTRPGALAPSSEMTRFTWSFAGRAPV